MLNAEREMRKAEAGGWRTISGLDLQAHHADIIHLLTVPFQSAKARSSTSSWSWREGAGWREQVVESGRS